MRTDNSEATIAELITWLIVGALLGAVFTAVIGVIGWSFYSFGGGFFVCLFTPLLWLVAAVYGIPATASWVPLGALAGATYALYRLHKSKGVRRTRIYLVGGILLAVVLALLVFWLSPPGHKDRIAIAARYTEFREGYNSGEYEQAYSYMSPAYRQTHSVEQFKSDFSSDHSKLGGIGLEELDANHSIMFVDDKAYLFPSGRWGLSLFHSGHKFEFEKVEGIWHLTGEYVWYLD